MILAPRASAQATPAARTPPRSRRGRAMDGTEWVAVLAWGSLAAALAAWTVISGSGDAWWLGTLLCFAPRLPFAWAAAAAAICALGWRKRAVWPALAGLLIAIGPVGGFRAPVHQLWAGGNDGARPLCVVSCNVQNYQPRFAEVCAEIARLRPDVIALQEAAREPPAVLRDVFPDWHLLQEDEFLVLSRFPLVRIDLADSVAYGRRPALHCRVITPVGPIDLINLHQMTPRPGLAALKDGDSRAVQQIEEEISLRNGEAMELRLFVNRRPDPRPAVIVGDFNMPSESRLFQRAWGDFQDAFEAAGWGFGYTSPCNGGHYWPDNCPWTRIDHILVTQEWCVERMLTGSGNGSDHRLVAAWLRLKPQEGN